jgi:ATP-dependent DNA ligase
MLATLGRPPARFADFAVEAKYDGQRGLPVVHGDAVTPLSRNGADITRTFPEITAALPTAVSQRSVILDGEIVALDDDVSRPILCVRRSPIRREGHHRQAVRFPAQTADGHRGQQQ